ncbi:MAG: tRNA glutamyl-Q(34) synthetase GluQRS [Myxococcales bacterium]|nr:tRNA glutamyl-Q(34) synthetase GluQRS [Myxococcales bacterium]
MRGRFAPSPTGRLHLGNARSALLGWLHARAQGGEFLLRVEDLDSARCRKEHVEELFADLDYLGLDFDGEVLFQSRRAEAYQAALAVLEGAGRSYPCFCTRSEIARAATAPHGPADDGPRYPGSCASLPKEVVASRERERPPALRFRVEPGVVELEDLFHGRHAQDVHAEVGDFVVRRNDGVASYQLAVVVDDAASGVTHVLRADDLLSSTARQLQLYRALGILPPSFAHVPLLLGQHGGRLAKREGAVALSELRRLGVPSERVIGLLARWSGLGDGRPIRARELIASFSLEAVRREPVMVRESELRELLGS